ncbi:MAG: nitroreductase family deazaflavin-dependent oxidoreductase [Chloroflexota bacterium]
MTADGLDPVASAMADAGDVVVLEIAGRRTGRVRRTAVGYVLEPDGSLLVAASTPYTQWALNLEAAARCRATIGGARADYDALRLPDDARGPVIAALILRYGTPAERLGAGPAFRLVPRIGGPTT